MNPFSSISDITSSSNDLILLMIIGILVISLIGIYFYFKSKLSKQNEYFTESANKEKDKEKNQNAFLEKMSDDIYNLTQDLVKPNETAENGIGDEILDYANNLRELLKIKSDNIEVFNEKFSFSHMLDDISSYLSSNFKDRDTEVVYDIDESVPSNLSGDVVHLSRIINNILEFSIQHTPQGKVTLKALCDVMPGNQRMLQIDVIDTSNGIAPERLTSLFSLVYNEKTNEQVGLGLYIARKLTFAINGTLKVKSSLGKGTIFTLRVPMQTNDESFVHAYDSIKKKSGNKKVLIFSDKIATGFSLKKLFSHFYNEVTMLDKKALEERKVNFIDYDIVVLDDKFFNTINTEYLTLIKRDKKIDVVTFSSIFSKKEQKNNTLIDTYIQTPSNLERLVDLVTQLNTRKEVETEIKLVQKNNTELDEKPDLTIQADPGIKQEEHTVKKLTVENVEQKQEQVVPEKKAEIAQGKKEIKSPIVKPTVLRPSWA